MNVTTLLDRGARQAPTALAWKHGTRSATYGELRKRVGQLAAGLLERGLVPGDRVVLCLPNRPELLEMLFATMWAGLVTVPVNWHLHPAEVRYVLGHCGARAVLVADETDAVLDGLPAEDPPLTLHADGSRGTDVGSLAVPGRELPAPVEVAPDAPAWLFYTSGTTGRPKGATLTHRVLLAMALNYYADVDPIAPGSVFAHAAPLTHGSGLYLVPAIGRAAVNVLFPVPSFDAQGFLDFLAAEQATHIAFLAPTMLHRLLVSEKATPLPALRSIVVGGAPLYEADLAKALARFGPIITQIYGQGEAPMTITAMHPDEAATRPLSCGRPFPGVEIRLLGPDGAEVPPGGDGEITVRGDVVMSGYWDDPGATTAAVHEGWLRTGDIGRLDDAGYLYLTDRARDVIITGGANVYPREVEEVLLTHPGVSEAAVVGVPDDHWGEVVTAFVVPEPGAVVQPAELITHVRTRLASFKKPRRVIVIDALPKNAAGKVLRRELSHRLDASGCASSHSDSDSAV